jgi:hypothetical protein
VLVDNASQGTPQSYEFSNIQANHTITVSFAINVYTITVSVDAHSTITPGNVSVNYGENQQFNITANSGYQVSHVYVDGDDEGKLSSYNFINVQGNHTISVSSETLAPTDTSTQSLTPSEALIAVIVIVIIIAGCALALKKGYVAIEVVDDSPEDYAI